LKCYSRENAPPQKKWLTHPAPFAFLGITFGVRLVSKFSKGSAQKNRLDGAVFYLG